MQHGIGRCFICMILHWLYLISLNCGLNMDNIAIKYHNLMDNRVAV